MVNKMIGKSADGVAGIQNWQAGKKKSRMNVYSSEGKSFSTSRWKESNAINLLRGGWLIPQAMAAYQSLRLGHCYWHEEDSAVVKARSALVRERPND